MKLALAGHRLIGMGRIHWLSTLIVMLVFADRGLCSERTTKYAAYWYIDSKTAASLEIVNTSNSPRGVDIILFVRGNRQVSIDPLVVPSLGTVRLSIGEMIDKKGFIEKDGSSSEGDKRPWGLGERPGSLWGTAELSSEDPDHLSASILMRDPSESIGVSTPFLSPSKFWSSKLQTFWWLPSPSSHAYFALENVRPRPIKVRVTLSSDGKIGDPEAFTLSPFETKLISLREMLQNSGGEFKNVLEIGGIELEHDGNPGDVIGRGFIVDHEVGFSLALTLEDPSRRTLNMLQNVAAPCWIHAGVPTERPISLGVDSLQRLGHLSGREGDSSREKRRFPGGLGSGDPRRTPSFDFAS